LKHLFCQKTEDAELASTAKIQMPNGGGGGGGV
jgi:hypothetical protein